MGFEKVILIFNTPALNSDIQTYSLWELFDLGYKVTVLDASPILMPDANRIVTAERLTDEHFESHVCNTKKELEYFIKQDAKKACFIPMFDNYYDVRFVFKLFTKYNVFYGHVTTARTELELSSFGIKYKKSWKNSRLNPMHLYKAFYNRIGRKLFCTNKAKFVVLGGKANSQQYINATEHDKNTKILCLHTWDYERFLTKEKYENNSKPYCVFLDQYFPFHPDLKTEIGFDFTEEDKQKFVSDMNKVFNHIRNNYNLEIIIAAHPRANYNDKKDLYPDVTIEYGKTAELIKGASLVVANFSNSIMFAVMTNVPIIIVNSSVIQKCNYTKAVLFEFVKITGAFVASDYSVLPKSFEIPICKEKYKIIEDDYFKSGESNGKKIWQLIMEAIK